jgi:hypothetical protein
MAWKFVGEPLTCVVKLGGPSQKKRGRRMPASHSSSLFGGYD